MRIIQGSDWNDDTIARLRHLWNEGRSTAEIGRHLGISKNAIIGKAHRLDLPRRKSPIKRAVQTVTEATPKRPPVPTLAEIMPITTITLPSEAPAITPRPAPATIRPTTAGRMSVHAMAEPCCWPLGDPGTAGFRYCDEPALGGKPYCEEHARSARRPSCERSPQPRRVPRGRDLNGFA